MAGGSPGSGVLLDSDGDGLSDTDEALAGTDPLNPDSDYDGAPDGSEVLTGTDPLDAESVFRIMDLNKVAGTGFVTATWSSVAGNVYTLEASSDMINWVVVASGIVASGSTTSQLDSSAAGSNRRFYRVLAE